MKAANGLQGVGVLAIVVLLMSMLRAYGVSDVAPNRLATPESFAAIADPAARSAALFTERYTPWQSARPAASKVPARRFARFSMRPMCAR